MAFAGQGLTNPPLEITEVQTPGAANGKGFSIDVRNISGKDIKAYVLALAFQNSAGKNDGFETRVAARGMEPSAETQVFKDGETTSMQIHPPNPEAVIHKISIDYVLFADGSTWGQDKWKESKVIRGELDGRDLTLSFLREKLDKEGADWVIKYLKNYRPVVE
jgi:hypothetical protein